MTEAAEKTTAMRLLEQLHPGKEIGEIVADACRRSRNQQEAAAALGITVATLRVWIERFDAPRPGSVAVGR